MTDKKPPASAFDRVNPFEMTCARYIKGYCVLIDMHCLDCHQRYICMTVEIVRIVRMAHRCQNGKRREGYMKVAAAS